MIPLLWYLLFPKAEGAKKKTMTSHSVCHHDFIPLIF